MGSSCSQSLQRSLLSSPEPTATSLAKYYPRNTVWLQTRTRHYRHDSLCPSIAVQRSPVGMPHTRLGCPTKCVNITRQLHEGMKGCVLYDGVQSGSFNINTGVEQDCVIAPTLFSIFLPAFISLAAVDQAKGVGIVYRTDGALFNMCHLQAKMKVKATSIVDLQYSDDSAVAVFTEADLRP